MSKDTIYREDAIKALRLEYPMMPIFKELREEWSVKTEGYRKAEEVITRLPSADRPQGEWELVPYKRIDEHGEVIIDGSSWCCSNCGDARKRNGPDMNFCPNCGARMKGVSHDSKS